MPGSWPTAIRQIGDDGKWVEFTTVRVKGDFRRRVAVLVVNGRLVIMRFYLNVEC